MSAISKQSKEYIVAAFTDKKVADEVIALLDKADKLVRQLEALLQKMDADTGIADTNYESTVESVK